jgi:hypothetical protein
VGRRVFKITARFARATAVLASVAASLALTAAPAGAASIAFIKGDNVWLASPDGSGQRQLTTGGGWQFASQADDGTILAQSGTQLIRMDRNGKQLAPAIPTTFTGAPSTWAGPVSPAISRDGVNQAYGGEITDSGYYDYGCSCWVYTHTFTTFWGSAMQYSQPNQTLGQEDYVDPAWIDNSHVMLSSTGILIDQVATYTLGGADNSMVQWFSDPDQSVQGLGSGAITRGGDKLAFVANVNGGVGNEIRIYSSTGPPPETAGDPPNVPIDQCNIGPNNFQSVRVSFSPDGQSLAYDAPDGVHLVTLTSWPSCAGLTDKLIIPGGADPYFGPADVGQTTTTATTPTTTSKPQTAARCNVPHLHGLGLAAARGRLQRAHCRLGHVRIPRSQRNQHKRLVIATQQPGAGRTGPRDTKVNVVLGLPTHEPHHH